MTISSKVNKESKEVKYRLEKRALDNLAERMGLEVEYEDELFYLNELDQYCSCKLVLKSKKSVRANHIGNRFDVLDGEDLSLVTSIPPREKVFYKNSSACTGYICYKFMSFILTHGKFRYESTYYKTGFEFSKFINRFMEILIFDRHTFDSFKSDLNHRFASRLEKGVTHCKGEESND